MYHGLTSKQAAFELYELLLPWNITVSICILHNVSVKKEIEVIWALGRKDDFYC